MENNLKYTINKEKGVVICTVTGCRWDALRRMEKYIKKGCFYEYIIPDTFIGKARCNLSEDTFDEKYGMKLALTRAKRARCQAINNAIKKFVKNEKRKLNELEKYGIHEVPEVKK